MTPLRLILIPHRASTPVPWLIVGRTGQVIDRGLLDPDRRGAPLERMRTVAIAPGADVVVRWLDLPHGGPAQVRAAAAWALRDVVATPSDRLVVAVGPSSAGEPRVVTAVGRSLVEAWVSFLEELGAAPDVIFPDVLAAPEPADVGVLNAVMFGETLVLRGSGMAVAVQPELEELIAQGRTVIPIEDAAVVEGGLVAAACRPPVNLLDGLRPPTESAGRWRRASAMAAAALCTPLILVAAQAARDEVEARRHRQEVRSLILRHVPDLADAADPPSALRQRASTTLPPGGLGAVSAALFTALEDVEGAELDILIADPGEGMKATLSHPRLEDVEAVRADLIRAGFSTTVTATVEDGGRIVSDLTIGGL
jgi:general secretion pathway protein L